ncbi:FAD-binding protein [Nannocystis sp.]|uniref:FAD-binding oxidoreductase n=1 Tax=Nannocystis sp. TaxID=1962667 RepID=UPI0024206D87|nr:FAD-binding protein [Nannocystis sp.]MBK7830086.1 FAD-binding oxidoreductase [Nannocystis sp.]MBK9752065.1 FAD-binding oxidoreductase [Nannocystis sp.]
MKQLVFDLLTRFRGVILLCLLPVGYLFDAVMRLRNFYYERWGAAPEQHGLRVAEIQRQVRRWYAQPAETRRPMCTDRRTWQNLSTRFEPKHEWHKIRMSGLRDVLGVDLERGTVRVEPFVTVGSVTRYLLPRGHMLQVTLEIEDATIGGLAMAVGMTTHSHKVGLLYETVVAYEVVVADGSLLRVTRDEHPELFHALPWSHGTLGLLVSLELKIMPVKPFVHLRYIPVHTQQQYCDQLRELSVAADAPDFLEATVYAKDHAVIMTGDFADAPTAPADRRKINPLGRWYKPWFFKHVETFLWKDGESEEYVPLRHYLMRHNRSIFWVVQHMISFGNHPVFRWLLGWLMPPRIQFIKFSTTPAVREMTFTKQVFQDIVLPMSAMSRAIDASHRLFEMYPVLLYPSRIYDHGPLQGQLRAPREQDRVPGTDFGMYFDLGVYGVPLPILHGKPFKTVHAMRKMEDFTREVGGYPFLYADTFMTREEFGQMFNLDLYEKVRAQYGADQAFPHLYDKIKPEVDVFAVLAREASEPD